jgi:hypothetical protein
MFIFLPSGHQVSGLAFHCPVSLLPAYLDRLVFSKTPSLQSGGLGPLPERISARRSAVLAPDSTVMGRPPENLGLISTSFILPEASALNWMLTGPMNFKREEIFLTFSSISRFFSVSPLNEMPPLTSSLFLGTMTRGDP